MAIKKLTTTLAKASDEIAPALSEEALALQFAKLHADKLRYVAAWGRWFIWDGTCWREDATRKVFSLARNLCREAANDTNSKGNDKRRIASAKTRAAVVTLAGEDRRLAATIDQWDTDPWLLNTPGGVVDLRTGKVRAHRPEDYMTKICAAAPDASCPTVLWNKFMGEVTGGNNELQCYLQRVSGYSLTGITREQEMFFFHGEGNNGKGVLVKVVSGILNDYHVSAGIETFTVSKSERHPTELAAMRGARLVTASETEEGGRWSVARIKMLTGEDQIAARLMRQDLFYFYPQFKLLFLGNHMPSLRSVNTAIRRRLNRVPFEIVIPKDKINPKLAEELQAERPGILAWMIEGCLDWQKKKGLCPPECVTASSEEYFESQDTLGDWIEDCCVRDPDGWESSTDLFNAWKPWAAKREMWVGSEKTFSQSLAERGGFPKRRNKEQTKRGFRGLQLKERPAEQQQASQNTSPEDHLVYIKGTAETEKAIRACINLWDEGLHLPKSQITIHDPVPPDPAGRKVVRMPAWLAAKLLATRTPEPQM